MQISVATSSSEWSKSDLTLCWSLRSTVLSSSLSRTNFSIMFAFLFLLHLPGGMFVRGVAVPEVLPPPNIDAMTTDITCRWSNCGEMCPVGFVSVPRKGGKKGEMMWDGSRCNGRGLSRLCCPSNQPQPTCRWAGHSNSGHCTPGCAGAEVEVWSISVGCKSGHQSACCTTSTSSNQAYDNCRWEGTSPRCWGDSTYHPWEVCSADWPNTAIESKAGFGGEEECKAGMLQALMQWHISEELQLLSCPKLTQRRRTQGILL
jgi:hypothetical protein